MNLRLNRNEEVNGAILGELYIDDDFQCYTLENKSLAIPVGIYPITLETSNRFQMVVPHLQDVPGRTEIEIHPGNTTVDTRGCVLVGTEKDSDTVLHSRTAFYNLMAKLSEPLSIVVVVSY